MVLRYLFRSFTREKQKSMGHITNPRLIILGGFSGITGILCYGVVAATSLSPVLTYAVAMAWPVLSIVFVYALYRYISAERQTAANQLAFVFAGLAFTVVACMISVQLAVNMGMEEAIREAGASSGQQELLSTIRRSMRWVDLGMDVAWDIFIGVALLFLSFALGRHKRFGRWWGIPSGVLGGGLIVLNIWTFPWPPVARNLFDIGPVIGLFILVLSIKLVLLGRELKKNERKILA